MKNKYLLVSCIAAVCMLLFAGCKHNDNPIPVDGPSEPSSFTSSPIDGSKISYLLSLGWIQPVGHTIPTDHVYFWYTKTNNIPLPVFAPGGGRINQILNVPAGGINECKVWIKMNDRFMYYLDHIVLDAVIKEGTTIKAGQQIATTGLGNSIDLGVIDNTITVPFANPARYALQTLHCGKPFQYFTEPLRSQLYTLVDREGSDKDGLVNTDVPDHLSGNWFLDDGSFYTDSPTGWDKELSFAYDIQHPSKVLVSIGGTLGLTGKWNLMTGVILPAEVTPANGKVVYPLWAVDPNYPSSATQRGLMLVQMTDKTHIKVQVFAGSTASDGVFDSNAKMYAR